MKNESVPCDTVWKLLHLLEHIPDDAQIRVNGKKALFRDDPTTYTIYLDSAEEPKDFFGF